MDIDHRIRDEFREIIHLDDTHSANEKLRSEVIRTQGLGVAILVAWQHGLQSGHIPTEVEVDHRTADPQQLGPDDDACAFRFVHVPVRKYRRDTDKLIELKILNPNPDPTGYVYHEDGLIGGFSFPDPESVGLTSEEVEEILRVLASQGRLVQANLDNRQIQFKDLVTKRRIEKFQQEPESDEDGASRPRREVYVRLDHKPLKRAELHFPFDDRDDVWKLVHEKLRFKFACNYCSVQALSPKEVTLNSKHSFDAGSAPYLSPVRNYQFGFTFSPIGDPREVCHFLAWDSPHISDLVMNMEPQSYSFSDLIRLVRAINHDISRYARKRRVTEPLVPISGGCNHWAGNSIYHQHYQFFRVDHWPLAQAFTETRVVAQHRGVQVLRLTNWAAPAFLIRASQSDTREQDVMDVADRVAREWGILNEGEAEPYGNKISIRNHTQNILALIDADDVTGDVDDISRVTAVFIPRHRSKVDTKVYDVEQDIDGADARLRVVAESEKDLTDDEKARYLYKLNAGVLEMAGYFVIDDLDQFALLQRLAPTTRHELGEAWLRDLSPDSTVVQTFEGNLRLLLNPAVATYEERIVDIVELMLPAHDVREQAQGLSKEIQHDPQLSHKQRLLLFRELVWAVLEATTDHTRPG